MIVINARNVNDALEKGLATLKMQGREEDSRNGPVIVAEAPVMTVYERPCERVLFSAARDANPFFHLAESLWMLAGANDVEFIANYASRMRDYSDDGEVLHGAYGFRWREWYGFDQLTMLSDHLRDDQNSRRAVLTMWSPLGDLVASEGYGGIKSKDLPCNSQAYFRLRKGKLTTTIMARSNDAVWGAYGANAVHFSVLHEVMARAIGVEPGPMYQFSNDFHIYRSLPQFAALWHAGAGLNPYERFKPTPLFSGDETHLDFLQDCKLLMDGGETITFYTAFFKKCVAPMLLAHRRWKAGADFRTVIEAMPHSDWKVAGQEWLNRRVGQ